MIEYRDIGEPARQNINEVCCREPVLPKVSSLRERTTVRVETFLVLAAFVLLWKNGTNGMLRCV